MNGLTSPIFAIVVVIFVLAGGAVLYRKQARGASSPSTSPSSTQGGTRSGDIEKNRGMLEQLLGTLGRALGSMLSQSIEFGGALTRHRDQLKRLATVEDLKDLEHSLLTQVEELVAANDAYRRELDEAQRLVEDQRHQLSDLETQAETDALTEMPNRRAFDERLTHAIDEWKRYEHRFSLVVIDIDHFKRINDTHGHQAGDRVLRAVGKVLLDAKRGSDFVARFGGEEFAVILPGTDAAQAKHVAERMRKKVEAATFRYQNETIPVTISAGIGESDSKEEKAESLFQRVDAALYRAKEGGRNRVESA